MTLDVRPAAPHRPSPRPSVLLAGLGGAVLTVLLAVLLTGPAWADRDPRAAAVTGRGEPPPDTIVAITGDAANGFEIRYHDGTALFPPTDSEALAECSEYDSEIEQVRCSTEVRTWYRDLADTQQALAWARHRPRG